MHAYRYRGFGNFDAAIPVVEINDYYNAEKKEEFLKTLSQACKKVGCFAVSSKDLVLFQV